MISTVALAVLDSAQAFSAPAMRAPARSSAVTMFSGIPTSCFGSLEAVPTFGWLQIMLFCLFQETGYGLGLAKGQTGGYASNPDNNEDDGERATSRASRGCGT